VHAVGPNTARRYAVSLRQLEPHLRSLHVDEIDSAKIAEIVGVRRDAGAGTATIRRDLTALSSVLEFAIGEGVRKENDNPALYRLKRLKERRDPIVLPDHSLIERVMAAASPSLAPLIRVALATGCRLNELVTAERKAVDHARRQLTLRGKGNKVRVIDLDFGGAYETVRAIPPKLGCKWLFWHEAGGSRRGRRKLHPGVQTVAQPYSGVSGAFHTLVRRVIAQEVKAAKLAGVPAPDLLPFRFHDLRHRHAVDWLQAGGSIYDLQKRLGHTSVKTTEIYLDFVPSEEERKAKYGESRKESQGQRFGAGQKDLSA